MTLNDKLEIRNYSIIIIQHISKPYNDIQSSFL